MHIKVILLEQCLNSIMGGYFTMDYSKWIEEQENRFKRLRIPNQRLFCINDIIQLKIHSKDERIKSTLYGDIKKFINYYVHSTINKNYGYDLLNKDIITRNISYLKAEEAANIITYLKEELKDIGMHNLIDWCDDLQNKFEIKHLYNKIKSSNIFSFMYWKCLLSLLVNISAYNIVTLLLFLVFIIFMLYMIFLPAPYKFMEIFRINYEPISRDFFINHFLNILSYLLSIDTNFSITPLNPFGMLILVVGKITYLVVLVNFVIKEITKRLLLK